MSFLHFVLTPILVLISWIYGLIIWVRNFCYDAGICKPHSFNVPVISVGNITTGGSGKTPLVIYLAQMLLKLGKKPAIVSRGYGRSSKGLVLVHDENKMKTDVQTAGDEPYLIASILKTVPVAVCENRSNAIKYLTTQNAVDIVIMDDGFQHRRVKRNMDILTISANDTENNYHLLPWGKLREPITKISRADMAIITKADNYVAPEILKKLLPHIKSNPLFSRENISVMNFSEEGYKKCLIPKTPVFAFCGIGEPQSFFQMLKHKKITIGGKRIFRDHQRYSNLLVTELSSHIRSSNCTAIITTEKDIVKLPNNFLTEFKIYVLQIETEFQNVEVLLEHIQSLIHSS